MKNVLLVSIFLTGCATSPSVGQILTETKTEKDRSVSCPATMIKVCDGPDKETIAKYEMYTVLVQVEGMLNAL